MDAAARATFLQHGHSAPVALIAAKLGVSHAALLQRAGSKEALLLRALAPRAVTTGSPRADAPRGLSAVVARLREPPPARASAARLIELLVELHSVLADLLPGLVVLRAGGLPTGPPPGIEAPTLLLRRLLAAWLVRTERVSRKRAPALAEALLGAIEARCFNAYLGGPAFVGEAPDVLAKQLVSALLPELGPSPRARGAKARPARR
jgi:AcrR family transcriptional regulator